MILEKKTLEKEDSCRKNIIEKEWGAGGNICFPYENEQQE